MTGRDNARVARRFHDEVIVGGDYAIAHELLAPDLVHLRGAIGMTIQEMAPRRVAALRSLQGPERFVEATKVLRSLFPVWDSEILELVASQDLVVTKCLVRGEVKKGFRGSPDGRPFELYQAVIHRIRDGRIAEIFALADQLDFWRALGVPGV